MAVLSAFWSHKPKVQIEHAVRLLDAMKEETIGIVSVGQDGQVVSHRDPKQRANPEIVTRLQAMTLYDREGRIAQDEPLIGSRMRPKAAVHFRFTTRVGSGR